MGRLSGDGRVLNRQFADSTNAMHRGRQRTNKLREGSTKLRGLDAMVRGIGCCVSKCYRAQGVMSRMKGVYIMLRSTNFSLYPVGAG